MIVKSRTSRTILHGEHYNAFRMAQGRLSILSICFIVGYLVLLARLIDLSIVQGTIPHLKMSANQVEQQVPIIMPRRGEIYDRNGFLLATTLKTPSVYVDPSFVTDPDKLLRDIAKIIPDLKRDKVEKALKAGNRFGWIAHAITPQQQKKILALGEPALGFQYQYTRIYPQGGLFAHMLGYTDLDGLGLSGVERSYDDILSKGDHINLTLDLRLQHVVKREVSKAMADFNAVAGAGLIMDAKTGEILAGVSLPDYDLNSVRKTSSNQKFNRLSLGVYELGSMFKIFSTAALFELTGARMGDAFDARKPLKVGWYKINDYHAQKRILNIPEVFVYSSNIGSALMGKKIGGKALQAFYKDLGLLDKMNTDIKEIGAPLSPEEWSETTTATASYGHGLATTPLQMASAVATIVNGGFAVNPHLKKKENDDLKVQIVSRETSEKMRALLRLVVRKGTGKNAELKGFEIGGKTGTAEKSINGRYQNGKLISSFVAAFPMHDPQYVIMVMVDEPKPNAHSYGYATAGWVAAPAVKNIVNSMVSILGLTPDVSRGEADIANDLLPFIKDPKQHRRLASYE